MTITRTDTGDETEVSIKGQLTRESAPEMQTVSSGIASDGRKNVTLDCTGLDLIDSQGVGAIIGLYKRVKTMGGTLKIFGIRDQPLAIFKLLRFDKLFDL